MLSAHCGWWPFPRHQGQFMPLGPLTPLYTNIFTVRKCVNHSSVLSSLILASPSVFPLSLANSIITCPNMPFSLYSRLMFPEALIFSLKYFFCYYRACSDSLSSTGRTPLVPGLSKNSPWIPFILMISDFSSSNLFSVDSYLYPRTLISSHSSPFLPDSLSFQNVVCMHFPKLYFMLVMKKIFKIGDFLSAYKFPLISLKIEAALNHSEMHIPL